MSPELSPELKYFQTEAAKFEPQLLFIEDDEAQFYRYRFFDGMYDSVEIAFLVEAVDSGTPYETAYYLGAQLPVDMDFVEQAIATVELFLIEK